MTALLTPLASLTLFGLVAYIVGRWVVQQIRANDDDLTVSIEAVLADPNTYCQVIVPAPCPDAWTVERHGWRMCDHHAAPFLAHATSRDELLDLEAHWEADSHHGVAYVEALANGLIDP